MARKRVNSVALGARQTARVTANRVISDSVNASVGKGVLGQVLIAGLRAFSSSQINKLGK